MYAIVDKMFSFHVIKILFVFQVLPRPILMKLILNGDAKNKQGSRQGTYILGEKLVNSYPYWKQQNGSNAIWFKDRDAYRYWHIGPKVYLGGGMSGIRGPRGIDMSPTRIVNGWRYLDNNGHFQDATNSEILFKDLSHGMITNNIIRFLLNYNISFFSA